MVPNCFLNIYAYAYAYRQVLFSALIREVSFCNEWWWIQKWGLHSVLVEYAALKRTFTASPLRLRKQWRGEEKKKDPKDREKGREIFSSGHNIANTILISQYPQLPAKNLHKTGPVNSQSWIWEGPLRLYASLLNNCPLMDSGERAIIVFSCVPSNNDPIRLQ